LWCDSNKLKSLDLQNNNSLTWVSCENNLFQVDGLNALFNSLPIVKSSRILIDHNPGTNGQGLNKNIAEKKGWVFYSYPPMVC